jgi:hypothetical protein
LGRPFAGFLTPSPVQGAVNPEKYIFVAYSPVYSMITTGYQASDASKVFTAIYSDLVQHQ